MSNPDSAEPTPLLLFTKAECELCDTAVAIFTQLCVEDQQLADRFELQKVDITRSDELFARYKLSIPVWERVDKGTQLYWPFPPSRLREFLR